MDFEFKRVLVTGAAGFIGFHLANRLLEEGYEVVGLDNVNAYYDVRLKEARLAELADKKAFRFVKMDLSDKPSLTELFSRHQFDVVVNLAAQAGVRYSLENPHAYVDSNLVGFVNILEGCRHHNVKHLVFASSSSVYGANTRMPFSVHHNVDHPLSLYAASKKANELMAHTYSSLYGLPATGLRFFTVYGPWGRPDMSAYIFTDAIFQGRPITIFNNGDMRRDFTYIDDIVAGTVNALDRPPADGGPADPPQRVYNLGNHRSEDLMRFITVLEAACGKEAVKEMAPMQPGDVKETYADIEASRRDLDFEPRITIDEGKCRGCARNGGCTADQQQLAGGPVADDTGRLALSRTGRG